MIDRPSRIVVGLACLVGIAAVGLRGVAADQEPREGRAGRAGPRPDRLAELERRIAEIERRLEISTETTVRKPVHPRLAGRWLMTLPAGFEHRVTLEPVESDRYRLRAVRIDSRGEGDNRLVFAGVYEIREGWLVIVEPDDDRLLGFGWKIHNPNTLILADQPEAGKTAHDYLGATLTRQVE